MARSDAARELDRIARAMLPSLQAFGFSLESRIFNRDTADGLIDVVELQMNRHGGSFTIDLGVYIPEVGRLLGFGKDSGAFVRESSCALRTRLGQLGPEGRDVWWELPGDPALSGDLADRLQRDAMPFFGAYDTRDKILAARDRPPAAPIHFARPRIVWAIVLHERGALDEARSLLALQISEANARNVPGHARYVRDLGRRMGFEEFSD